MKGPAAYVLLLATVACGTWAGQARRTVTTEQLRKAIEAGSNELVFHVGTVSFVMVRIPAGEFDMGSPPAEVGHDDNEGPVKRVRITRPFYIGRFEVTQAQYYAVTGLNPSNFRGDTLAMDQIVYPKAIDFCRRLSQAIGIEVTLPTEAQWEYACRAGTKTRFYSGNAVADLDKIAWHEGNSNRSVHPIGQKQPNNWGLYDMLGNVWELCLDHILSFEDLDEDDPRGSVNPGWGTMRGGGYLHGPEYCRAACRLVSNARLGFAGMRIAINP